MLHRIRALAVALLFFLALTSNAQEFGQVNDLFLSPKTGFNIERVRTFVTMQKHVNWVSQQNDDAVLQSLRSNGYQVVGDRLITSEAPDDSLKRLYTTGRLRCYVAVKGQDVIVCFRGSGGSNLAQVGGNLVTDLHARKVKPELVTSGNRYANLVNRVEVHAGFHKAYQKLRPEINQALDQHKGKNLYFFGHSLGGAQATLCAFDYGLNRPNAFPTRTLLVSGCPRVGDGNFRNLFESVAPGACRLTVEGDPVPRVPSSSRFLHVGDLINLKHDGTILGARDLKVDLGQGLQRTWAWPNHDYPVYAKAMGGLHYQASAREYFNGKQDYAKSLGNAERGLAKSSD